MRTASMIVTTDTRCSNGWLAIGARYKISCLVGPNLLSLMAKFQCSQTCDGGTSTQTFHCRNDLGEENHLMCDRYQKPQNVIRCNKDPCPKWKVGDWSPNCDSQCERHRQVRCMDDKSTSQRLLNPVCWIFHYQWQLSMISNAKWNIDHKTR